jgi:hypothetical protein
MALNKYQQQAVLTLVAVVILIVSLLLFADGDGPKQKKLGEEPVEITKFEGGVQYFYRTENENIVRTVFDDGLECVTTYSRDIDCDWGHNKIQVK